MAAPRSLLALGMMTLLLAPLAPTQAGDTAGATRYAATSDACATVLLATDHCIVHQAGTLTVQCQGDLCTIRFEGGAVGESAIPMDLRFTSRVETLEAPPALTTLHADLCREATVGNLVQCAYQHEATYVLPRGACLTLRHRTELAEGLSLFQARAHQDLRVCRDSSGQPAIALLEADGSPEALAIVPIPTVALVP